MELTRNDRRDLPLVLMLSPFLRSGLLERGNCRGLSLL
jgi:hypothetical protein